jgi:hypothetical protein
MSARGHLGAEPVPDRQRRAWWRRQQQAAGGELLGPDGRGRCIVNDRAWPGLRHYRPPRRVRRAERLRDRIAIILVVLPRLGALPERLGLAGFLVMHGNLVLDAGIVVEDGLAESDPDAYRALIEWCRTHASPAPGQPTWRLVGLTEFCRDVLYRQAYKGRCLVLGADLGRTFGLLAAWWSPTTRRGWREGLALGLPGWGIITKRADGHTRWSSNTGHPQLYVQAVGLRGIRVAFGRPRKSFPGTIPARHGRPPRQVTGDERWGEWDHNEEGQLVPYPGRFVDLVAAAFALDGIDHDDLADHLAAFGIAPVEPRAVRPDPGGATRMAALLAAQHRLAVAVDAEAAAWRIDLRGLHSSGTLAEVLLTRLGVTPPVAKFNLSRREYQAWTAALHGGWVTADATGQLVAGADLDVRSCYPTLAYRLGWWNYLTAENVRARRVTRELRSFLAQPLPALRAAMRDPTTWQRWGCTRVVVRPRGEPWPLETAHPADRSMSRLVVHPVEADRRHGTWLDAVAATVAAGHPVEVLEAVRLVPEGTQAGLRSTELLGARLCPGRDPTPRLVALRTKAQDGGSRECDRRADALRGVANALTYGNLARFDPAGDSERPGPWCWPPLAATITAAARCVLALAEADLAEAGLGVICRDTDGVVVSPTDHRDDLRALDEILDRWNRLAIDGGRFWTITRGTPESPVHVVSFGPKRYALLQHGRIVDATEHIIGAYVPPPTMPGRNARGRHDWTAELARAHADVTETGRRVERLAWEHGPGEGFPTLRRRQLTDPTELDTPPAALGAHPFSWIVEAVPSLISAHVHPIALDPGDDLAGWRDLAWFDARTGEELQLTTDLAHIDERDERVVVVAEPLREKALDWARPRPWPLPEVILVDPLLVRGIGRAGHRFLTGYADTARNEIDMAAVLAHVARLRGAVWLAEVLGISASSAKRIRRGARRPDAISRATWGLRANGLSLPRLLDLAEDQIQRCLRCQIQNQRRGSVFCSDRCAQAHRRWRDRNRKRRARAAATRGVRCRCGATVGFGDVAPGWTAECCPSAGAMPTLQTQCPSCGAVLLGAAAQEPSCPACRAAMSRGDEA